jgi:hypothetical protein
VGVTGIALSNPLPNGANNIGTVNLNTSLVLYTGQAKIATTGTAVYLTGSSTPIVNQVTVKSLAYNTSDVMVGLTGVTNTEDGTGNGFILSPGDSVDIPISNISYIFVNGAAGSIVSYLGN